MTATNWTCPYCNRPQTLTGGQSYRNHLSIALEKSKYGRVGIKLSALACANPDCQEVTLSAYLTKDIQKMTSAGYRDWQPESILETYRLRPQGASKPQPPCVPGAIAEDYYEACKIRDLSPKASATLSRRCLQGMIRDFCKISKSRLIDEIKALQDTVTAGTGPVGVHPDTIEAIDHVRSIGNIGAHMEKDVDLIIPVEPEEAQALIELIELLFEEWYVARDVRQQRLDRVKTIGAEKQALKASKVPSP